MLENPPGTSKIKLTGLSYDSHSKLNTAIILGVACRNMPELIPARPAFGWLSKQVTVQYKADYYA